ncbi:hypothetical protein [Mucilaginibacter ginsenosidivorax]|uniref:Uncharacterized protein n=1 Tax=Mucilaginibacter ginsenosidivorax TaxID=862126 RepID=A0A5B8W0W8_9SPHI|nr:hypothetical protein [Mucilaginibacter ginsenosidivorax]QEC75858.1 hypothetical protein FSB76_07820 [Mucilaginibacter ginsenosidivorax]
MEYLIATIVIMLFCITALAQEKSPESAIIISRDKPKPLKTEKANAKQMTRHICTPAFTNLPQFTGLLCLHASPTNGDGALSLYLPARYGHVTVSQPAWAYRYQLPSAVGNATETGGYMAILPQFKPAKFIWQSILFCHKKITT